MIPELPTAEEITARTEQVGILQTAHELNECVGSVRRAVEHQIALIKYERLTFSLDKLKQIG